MNKTIAIQGPTQEQKDKLAYLESLGLNVESFTLSSGECFANWSSDYDYEIDLADFEIGDPISEIEKYANIYSCCGDILDTDYMICPTCKEHC
jgi:hypothetical protein